MSDLIKDWLPGFLERHRQRFAPHDWPESETEDDEQFARLWFRAFMDLEPRVRESEADTASIRLGQTPPRWRSDHLPAIIAEIKAVRQANGAGRVADSKEDAERRSIDCELCGGSGLACVYHWRYEGSDLIQLRDSRDRLVPFVARVNAHCTCPMGRWMRSKFRDVTILGRIPDLEQVLAGNTRWHAAPPAGPEFPATGEPADYRRMVRSLADSTRIC